MTSIRTPESLNYLHIASIAGNFNNLKSTNSTFDSVTAKSNAPSIAPALMQSPGQKMLPVTTGQWNVVASMPAGTSGILKTLWLAAGNMNIDTSLIRIRWDQHTTADIGTDGTSWVDAGHGLSLDTFFGAQFNQTNTFQNDYYGCNEYTNTQVGGYLQLDAPFSNGFSIEIAPASNGLIWCQPFVTIQPITTSLRLRSNLWLYQGSTINNASSTSFNEMTVLSTTVGPEGLRVKTVKYLIIVPATTQWWEGKWRCYEGSTVISGINPYTVTALGQTSETEKNYVQSAGDTSAKLLFESTGQEDFVLSSYNWSGPNNGVYNNRYAGTLFNTSAGGSNGALGMIRNFPSDSCAPGSNTPGKIFTMTTTNSDQTVTNAVVSQMTAFTGMILYLN